MADIVGSICSATHCPTCLLLQRGGKRHTHSSGRQSDSEDRGVRLELDALEERRNRSWMLLLWELSGSFSVSPAAFFNRLFKDLKMLK